MSGMSERERALRIRFRDQFEPYAAACLKIKNKTGVVAPFILNRSQRYLHAKLEHQRRTTGRVRALVLKSRQVGVSTYIAGRFYWRETHSHGFKTFILAHLDDASQNLFNLARRFHDNCPTEFRPATGSANAKELTFPGLDGGYKVGTAGSQEVGRSDTIHLFHGSEMAFWQHAEKHSAGLQQAIADVDGSEDIRESTANGIGNAFHSMWQAAIRGNSGYLAIFIPWFWHEEYEADAPDDWQPTEKWREYAELHSLTRRQVYWAWCKNRDMAAVSGGGVDDINWKFRQEYPSTADEAFQTSGESFIPAIDVLKARKREVEGFGPIILGVDPARGGGDKTGIIDRQGRRAGRHVCTTIDHRDLMAVAGEVVRIVKDLKPKGLEKVCIDVTGLGAGLYDRLHEQLGNIVEPVNFGESALEGERFANRRAEMWDHMREWFEMSPGVQIPDRDDLHADVCAPVRGPGATRFDSAGRLLIESKEHIHERLKASPDLGDGLALTFAIDLSLKKSTGKLNYTDRRYG